MSLFDTKAPMIQRFYKLALEDDIFGKMSEVQRNQVTGFLAAYDKVTAPTRAMEEYYIKLAPIQTTFSRTRTMARAQMSLLDGWSEMAGNLELVLVDSGSLRLGEDEAEDLTCLIRFQAAFVKHFGAAGLPPGLKADEVKKQNAAHLKARAEMPSLPPSAQISVLNADQRGLVDACDAAFSGYHHFLEELFGKKGDAAYQKKVKYAYDRRVGKGRVVAPPAPSVEVPKDPPGTVAVTPPHVTPPAVTPPVAGAPPAPGVARPEPTPPKA